MRRRRLILENSILRAGHWVWTLAALRPHLSDLRFLTSGVRNVGAARIRPMLAVGLLALAGVNRAGAIEGSAELGWFSQHVFRGEVLSDRPALFPAVEVSTDYGLRAGLFGVLDLTDDRGRRHTFSEVAGLLAYALPPTGPVRTEIGYAPTYFPGADDKTEHEAFLHAALDLPLTPALSAYVDMEDAPAAYASLGIGRGWPVARDVELDIGLSLGAATAAYNREVYEVDRTAINDMTLTAELSFAITEHLTLSVTGRAMRLPDGEVRRGARETRADDRAVAGGLTVRGRF